MAGKIKVPFLNPDGSTTNEEGTLIEVIEAKEPFSEYTLNDGTKIILKQELFNVVKLNEKVGPKGEPIYSFQTQQSAEITPKMI